MALSKTPLTLQNVVVLLTIFSIGCSDSFSRRVADTVEYCVNESNEPDIDVGSFWRNEQCLYLLQTATATIRTNGIIVCASIGSDQMGRRAFFATYLSRDANTREIVFMKGEEIILSMASALRPNNKFVEEQKRRVMFFEGKVWQNADYPFHDYRIEDLSVKLVKDDGSVIGPVGILSSKDFWENIRSKMFTEKKWQDKFPWLYTRLLEDPSMPPMWQNPELLSITD